MNPWLEWTLAILGAVGVAAGLFAAMLATLLFFA